MAYHRPAGHWDTIHGTGENSMSGQSVGQNDIISDVTSALQRGDLAGATGTLERALERDPDNAAYHDQMAGVLYLARRHSDALLHARRAVELAPDVAKYLRGEATILIALDCDDEAIEKLEKVLALTPRDVDARNDLGATYMKIGDFSAAEEQFRRAIDDDPGAITVQNNLAFLLGTQNRLAEAEDIFEALLDRMPNNPDLLYQLSHVRFRLNHCLAAESSLRQALDQRPDFVDALVLLAQIRARRGFFEESRALIRRVQSLRPRNPRVFELLANIYISYHKPREAINAYKAALKIDPISYQALAGLSLFGSDQWGLDLCQQIDRARKALGPENINLRINLDFAKARALERVNKFEESWHEAVRANRDYCTHYRIEEEQTADVPSKTGPRKDDTSRDPSLSPSRESGQPPFVIITGMPRSGKSTAEELMARVSSMKRGYESNIFSEIVEELNQRLGLTGANMPDDPMTSYFSEFRELLQARLADHLGGCSAYTVTIHAEYLINNIDNIKSMMPNVYFIFTDRDIWDNALRIFLSNYIKGDFDYAYRLSSIMGHIRSWRSAVHDWLKAEPERCLAVGYQQMVADPSSTLARICKFCDLPMSDLPLGKVFDDTGCAAPYKDMMMSHLKDEGWLGEGMASWT